MILSISSIRWYSSTTYSDRPWYNVANLKIEQGQNLSDNNRNIYAKVFCVLEFILKVQYI